METKMSNCHNGPKLVINNRRLQIFGASMQEAEDNFYNFDLVISLEFCSPRRNKSSFVVSGNVYSEGFKKLVDDASSTEHIRIYWPDYGIPQLDKKFWQELACALRKKGRDSERFDK